MKHIMLDLETLGTRSNAAIVAIGAVEFDLHGDTTRDEFYSTIALHSSVEAGLDIDPSTVLWWLKQSDAARSSTFPDNAPMLRIVLTQFNDWLRTFSDNPRQIAVWGNGATFDNVIIRNAFSALNITPRWVFRNDKCYRTIVNLLPEAKQPPWERQGTAHNALDDAKTQALRLQKVYKILGIESE